jgi:TRAP-type mannitol/chloroaromatic compound transport system permease small subunit
LLQELEWHLHTALFALVLGFGTIYNTHVRVDLIRDHVSFRKKAWIEFLGLSCFMIPYLLLVIWFASSWVADSYRVGEISASTVGLSHRWIIKGVLVAGLVTATLAGIAVWLQVVVLLWGHARMAGGSRLQGGRQGAHQARGHPDRNPGAGNRRLATASRRAAGGVSARSRRRLRPWACASRARRA